MIQNEITSSTIKIILIVSSVSSHTISLRKPTLQGGQRKLSPSSFTVLSLYFSPASSAASLPKAIAAGD